MNIEFDTYKQKLNDCRPALDGLAESEILTYETPLAEVRDSL